MPHDASNALSGIRQALIQLDPADADRALLASWGNNVRHGCVAASDNDYLVIRDLLDGMDIPVEGNF